MQICFKLHVCHGLGTGSGDRLYSHVVEMPFVPPVGMEVIDGDWSGTVESLVYADGWTLAFVETDRTTKDRTTEEMDRLEKEYIEQGWIRSPNLLSV